MNWVLFLGLSLLFLAVFSLYLDLFEQIINYELYLVEYEVTELKIISMKCFWILFCIMPKNVWKW
mgnify:CR=1 FL=1